MEIRPHVRPQIRNIWGTKKRCLVSLEILLFQTIPAFFTRPGLQTIDFAYVLQARQVRSALSISSWAFGAMQLWIRNPAFLVFSTDFSFPSCENLHFAYGLQGLEGEVCWGGRACPSERCVLKKNVALGPKSCVSCLFHRF